MKNESQNPITTPDWRAERLAAIKRLYPDLFTDEGGIHPIELGALITDGAISIGEKFEFRWPGKMQAKRHAFTSSKARLAPDMDRSVNFEETKNVIIEGENLEVLKLLSKAYYNKVKCIYIDPPYNTGHDFVYSDDYSEGKQAYWEQNGVFHDGVKVDTNSESAGRYHTNWLNMMMPRLLLAQMMLKDDGVIFVSIDDNEVHNLRKLMDEIFGEENFVVTIVWEKVHTRKNSAQYFSYSHDYIVCYAKNKLDWKRRLIPRENTDAYSNPDGDPKGPWKADPIYANNPYDADYKITKPNGVVLSRPQGRYWRLSEAVLKKKIAAGEILWGEKNSSYPMVKRYLSEVQDGLVPTSLFDRKFAGDNAAANAELKDLLGVEKLMDYPKPTKLIKRLLQISTHPHGQDLVVDFFAGSGTTGHSVMELNHEDVGDRKFVLVQLPEAINSDDDTYRAGYKKISDITIERVKRAGARIRAEKPEVDVGFKVFTLTTSIFPENTYQPDPEKLAEENVLALKEHIVRAKQQLMFDPKGKETDLMYETLIKQGFMLTMTKERLKEFVENDVWQVMDGDRSAIICLDAELKDATVKALAKYKDNRFIGLHRAVDTTKKWELTQTFGEALVLI